MILTNYIFGEFRLESFECQPNQKADPANCDDIYLIVNGISYDECKNRCFFAAKCWALDFDESQRPNKNCTLFTHRCPNLFKRDHAYYCDKI